MKMRVRGQRVRSAILIEDSFESDVYHRVESEFFIKPISAAAKGLYLVITSLGRRKRHSFKELCDCCIESPDEVMIELQELQDAHFDLSTIVFGD